MSNRSVFFNNFESSQEQDLIEDLIIESVSKTGRVLIADAGWKSFGVSAEVSAVISETKDHILLGGGQEAMSVTTTSGKVGKFEIIFV